LIVTEQQNKKERINMKSKTKNNKVPKSDKSRLSDLIPKKDARGSALPPNPAPTPPGILPPPPGAITARKKIVTL
jgi:hypothetical protein